MSHIHILFTILIILNITTNRLIAAAASKYIIYQILMKFFGMRTNAENTQKSEDSEIFPADTVRCGRQSPDPDALPCGRGLFAHLYCRPMNLLNMVSSQELFEVQCVVIGHLILTC